MKRVLFVLFAAAALVQLTLAAQDVRPAAPPEIDALKRLTFRNIGPANQAGRVSVIVGVPGNPNVLRVGRQRRHLQDRRTAARPGRRCSTSRTCCRSARSRSRRRIPNIIYVGTGEENPRNNASFGDGVYRSNDGGETWTHVGLEDSDRIARIRIDSRNPDVAYACAMGHEWGPSEERGVYKTTDGGKNVDAPAVHQRADRLLRHRRRSRQLRHRLRRACGRYRR